MIKHVVMWKFKPGTEKEASEFLQALRDLDGKIPELRSMEIGRNEGSAYNCDAVLITTFDDFEGLHAYATNPLHVAASSLCKSIRVSRHAVDFVIDEK